MIEVALATTRTTILLGRLLRSLLCVAVAASLHAQLSLTPDPSDDHRSSPIGWVAGASQSEAIQANRGNNRLENSKQRKAPDAPFVLLAAGGRMGNRERRAVPAAAPRGPWFTVVEGLSGRSPPQVSQ